MGGELYLKLIKQRSYRWRRRRERLTIVDVEIEREPMMKREKDNACIVKGERKSFFFFRERDQKAKNTDNVREEGKIKGKGF